MLIERLFFLRATFSSSCWLHLPSQNPFTGIFSLSWLKDEEEDHRLCPIAARLSLLFPTRPSFMPPFRFPFTRFLSSLFKNFPVFLTSGPSYLLLLFFFWSSANLQFMSLKLNVCRLPPSPPSLLFTRHLPSLRLCFFILSQYLPSLFSPLCSRSVASRWDFPSDTRGDAGSRRLAVLIGRPWPPALNSQQSTSPSLSFVPSSPLVPFSSPTSHKDFTFSSPVFLASFLPFFSLSLLLCNVLTPLCHPFLFPSAFFLFPTCVFTSLLLFPSPSLLSSFFHHF